MLNRHRCLVAIYRVTIALNNEKIRGEKIELLELSISLYQMQTIKEPVQHGSPDYKGNNLDNFNLRLGLNPRYANNHL